MQEVLWGMTIVLELGRPKFLKWEIPSIGRMGFKKKKQEKKENPIAAKQRGPPANISSE